ncbi:MAG: MarR family transcriptional regulator [Thermoplasmata archaeon]|nr:MarR family transcriptional regulator [Thermoplasmata archaeon]
MNKTRTILSKIGEENTVDVEALSRELGLRGPTVQAMIDLMVHQGYLEEIRCGSGCSMCPMNCSSLTSSKIKMYRLTGKGMGCIKGTQVV